MMIPKAAAMALLLPAITTALIFDRQNCLKPGQLQVSVTQFCHPDVMKLPMAQGFCEISSTLANIANNIESLLFCSHKKCGARYDPPSGLCHCVKGPGKVASEVQAWPEKNCKQVTTCYAPLEAHWNPFTRSCTCAIETFPKRQSALVVFKPKLIQSDFTRNGCEQAQKLIARQRQHTEKMEVALKRAEASHQKASEHIAKLNHNRRINGLQELDGSGSTFGSLENKASLPKSHVDIVSQSIVTNATSLASMPTYIPPPDIKVTQELLQESLQAQPQQLATVGSVIPHFGDGVISFLIQLDGPISQTLTLNATDHLPCDTAGATPPPSLELAPHVVRENSHEAVQSTCFILAINMYDPHYITYWVQREDGSIFSLLSDNKIHAINQLNASQPASITIRVIPANRNEQHSHHDHKRNEKRGIMSLNHAAVPLKRRQIFSIDCNSPCPFYHMDIIKSTDGRCGCMFKGADEKLHVNVRAAGGDHGNEEQVQYTSVTTAKVCAAMSCSDNGGSPALFNPFTSTCWCISHTSVKK